MSVALREAVQFDRRLVSPQAGLLAAIPVVAVLGGALALGQPVAAVTMGAGAMLVGIAWRTSGGRPPLALMTADALVMAASTFVGSVSGSVAWVHLIVLCLWSVMAGLMAGVGNRGGAVGTQAIIAVVVFGRFSEPAGAALGLATLILAGGMAQVVFLSLVRWPMPLRLQRTATAAAYRALADLATARPGASSLPAATALDQAGSTLSTPTLFGDPALMTLRTVFDEGHRIRVQINVVRTLSNREPSAVAPPSDPAVAAAQSGLDLAAQALRRAADSIEGDRRAAGQLHDRVAELTSLAGELEQTLARPGGDGARAAALEDPIAVQIAHRLAGLAGQLRAVCGRAPAAGEGGGLRSRRPFATTHRPRERALSELAQIRASASLKSPVGRHALRLAVVVPLAELIATVLPLQRGYWMVVAAAVVLRPEFGATFTRGAERAIGTCVGVGLAGLIAVALHPAGGATVVIVGLLAWAGYATFPASFAAGFCFITALVVFLLNVLSPDALATATARLLDTVVGSAIGLAAYALWPTWSRESARQSLAALVDADRSYLSAVLNVLTDGGLASEAEMRSLARAARLARTNADSTVARSLGEPATRRIGAEQSQGLLGAMRRLLQTAQVLRLYAQEDRPRGPVTELEPLASDIDHCLRLIAESLAAEPPQPLGHIPDLRGDYGTFQRASDAEDPDRAALLSELDEIVDAVDTAAALAARGQDEPEPRWEAVKSLAAEAVARWR
jgi:uncharacterized membrane protein YccC